MIARGSTLELETQVSLAADLEFASDEAAEELSESAVEIARMLNGLIAYFNEQ